ncbi:endolytic transglycosylase MltG [Fructilactobacillus fructivorans]|uniref:Endolytic murein transglycosylase n=1 Tax=Fructilactobacillus fructivorans TaxID=1614 RepID=A0A0C1PQF5_9LACO|nr:endolytic transglycosylase MltG [Fructilactobacillus fructivorans]KID42126.1 protein YceG like [Fructilactobacillus fructivorans]MCT0152018.1 endolytic transglycosylase MltG [Fructilactobacillus fructivorans]MCT2867910.1 endolytic transglycosylase MltG [Fructilactobacillus fructivorans]MCT2868508.1 endolytic transglycosylase MltG [Fructilactobacillus fructivorans]MCT2873508.1 endolytic transglycosylase MltG [Fructilactobacillus fructivorans]
MDDKKKRLKGVILKAKTSSFGKKIIYSVIVIIVILVIAIVLIGHHYFKTSLQPLDPHDQQVTQVDIPRGSSTKKIGAILQKSKVVKSGMVFNYYVKSHNITNFKSGYYQLKPSMSLDNIAQNLQKGGSSEPIQSTNSKLIIPEGDNIDQIADIIAKNTDFSKDEFLSLMKDRKFFDAMVQNYPELLSSAKNAKDTRYFFEGYLYPATYPVPKHSSLKMLVSLMLAKSNAMYQPYYQRMKDQKLTVQQTLTLASLIGREGVSQDDRNKMAGVLRNRIEKKMPLQSDVAVLYALHKNTKTLSKRDLTVNSKYNLYINQGFGPGPFDSPSLSSVHAVLYPTDMDKGYLYFLADNKTKKIYYAKNLKEQQNNIKTHINR